MSYLDVPRIHFSGEFFADPSTANNSAAAHNNAAPVPGLPGSWNNNGRHHFNLRNCRIRSVVDDNGAVSTASAQDNLVLGTVDSTAATGTARLVDLDPHHQSGSQVWGLTIGVTDSLSGEGFSAVMETASLRELWTTRRPGSFAVGFGGTYQSVLDTVVWSPIVGPMRSPVLNLLRTRSGSRLSIRFITWAYDATPGSVTFCVGQIAGTIGPSAAAEPAHFIPQRRVVHAGTSAPAFGVAPMNSAMFNQAPMKVDTTRRKLIVDLGNALPEDAAGARRPIGNLRAEIVNAAGPPTVLGSAAIPNTSARFLQNAGVEEIDLTAAQVTSLASRIVRFTAGPDIVLAERTDGLHVDVEDTVVRLDPTDTKDIELVVTRFGAPAANTDVHVGPSLASGRPAALTALSIRTGAPAFTTNLTPLPGRVRTGANGRVTIRLVAGNPGNPRTHVDGAVSWLGFFIGASATAATMRGEIAIRVFDKHPVPASPRLADVQTILTQYARLYPSMRAVIDLGNHATVQSVAPLLAASIRRPVTNGNYMPVSRDLSRDKKTLLLRWLDAGAPA